MSPRELRFTVPGIAQPQGSARAFVVRGRAVVTHDNPLVRSWRREIYLAAEEALAVAAHVSHGLAGVCWPRPVALRCAVSVFLPRPKSLPKRVLVATRRPDADKLLRACLDALTGLCWADDSQVCEAWVAKSYGDPPRAEFEVSVIGHQGAIAPGCPRFDFSEPEDAQHGNAGENPRAARFGPNSGRS